MDGWEFPGGPGVRSSCFHCGGLGWIQSLVKEVRSCKSCGTAKKGGGGRKEMDGGKYLGGKLGIS